MNQNPERYAASQSVAKLTVDGMISLNTRDRCIKDIARTTGYTVWDVTGEVERLTELYERAEAIG